MSEKMGRMKELGIDQQKFDVKLRQFSKETNMPGCLISERALQILEKAKPGELFDINNVLQTATKDLLHAAKAIKKDEPKPDKQLAEQADLETKNKADSLRKINDQDRLINIVAGAGAEKSKDYCR